MKQDDDKLRRDIGLTGSAFLAFNGVVGAGIFAMPESLYVRFGAFSPWLFPIFALLILLIVLPFGRVASLFPVSGGPVVYARAAYGPFASFQIGWIYYLARVTALAANANVFVTYAATLWPPLAAGVGRAAAILLLCGLLTFINIVGVKRALRFLDALTILKAAPLIGMAIYGLIVSAGPALPTALPPLSEVEVAALLVLYAFVGFENAVVPAGETANPSRNIPRALIATIIATAALYFVVQLAYVSVMEPGAGGDAPLVAFGAALMGPAGALLLTAAALFSLTGNLTSILTSTSRVTFALARDAQLPSWFGRVSEKYGTPANSILFLALFGAALALTGSFVWLAVVSTLARLVVYSASIAALPKVRRDAEARGEPVAGRTSSILLVAASLAVCLWAAFQTDWPAWRMLLVLIAAGSLLYWLTKRSRGGPGDPAGSNSAATVSSIQPPPSTRSPS